MPGRALPLRRTAIAVASTLLLCDAGSAAERLVAQASFAGRTFLLEQDGVRGRVRSPERVVELPADVQAYALAATVGGWIATAVRPTGQDTRVVVLTEADGARSLPGPRPLASLQSSPQPIVDSGEWRGLLWLEGGGPRGLGVRAAERSDGGFAEAVWVSEPGPAPVLAPEVTVLADGSWLAVWSTVAGGDEDIVYSWSTGGVWTAPRRVHADNAVPDVTPALSVQGLGAVAAWGRYDGSRYRVRTSRFESGAWIDDGWLSDTAAAHPYFVDEAGSRALVVPATGGDDWALYALGGDAGLEAVGEWTHSSTSRPVARHRAGRWNLEFGP